MEWMLFLGGLVLTGLIAGAAWVSRYRAQLQRNRDALMRSYERTYVGLQGFVGPAAAPVPAEAPVGAPQERAAPSIEALSADLMRRASVAGQATVALTQATTIPPDMRAQLQVEQEQVLRDAKLTFMRLIAAWDNANTDELRATLGADAYDRLVDAAKLAPREGAPTDIITLTAEAVDRPASSVVAAAGDADAVHVRFSGLYRTALASAARRFDTVWSFQRSDDGLRVIEIQPI
ncbi:hypothetical protein [Piscinibacterium candidicorallinum]|uniref:Tim44-like domain-containing protein n=1 Tax=Piscinibacterium candidicorallinum TaxID=1793872 RepID=A0ABV7H2M1_9BURK